MATAQATVDRLLESLAGVPDISTRKMFGEYALYHQGKIVALVADDLLFVKITPTSRTFLDESYDAPPYPGAKPHIQVPEDRWEDRKWLADLILKTSAEVPEPKPKKPKGGR